jgi:hypothetical protein
VPSDKRAPKLSSFGLTNTAFVVGPNPDAKPDSAVGTIFSYKLSEPARVAINIERKRIGYRKHGQCKRLTAHLRHTIRRQVRHRLTRHHHGHHHRTHAQRKHLRKRIHRAYVKNLNHHRCPKRKSVGELEQIGSAGANQLPFSGWIGNKALKAGKYRATIVATDAGHNSSVPERARFTVLIGG